MQARLPSPGFRILIATAMLVGSATASARAPMQDLGIDPGVLADAGSALLRRAPDAAVDGIFQSVHAASQDEAQARVLCTLFEPDADRSLSGLNAVATQLPQASRDRFANAVTDAVVGAMQSPPQPYDPAAAQQSLKAAGATAAILHDGFVRGLTASGADADSRAARCQSLRWLFDAMQSRPPTERAAMTRWLFEDGLSRLGAGTALSGDAPGK